MHLAGNPSIAADVGRGVCRRLLRWNLNVELIAIAPDGHEKHNHRRPRPGALIDGGVFLTGIAGDPASVHAAVMALVTALAASLSRRSRIGRTPLKNAA